MQKTNVGPIEITALVDLVQSYPAATVYPELGDSSRFSGYLDGVARKRRSGVGPLAARPSIDNRQS